MHTDDHSHQPGARTDDEPATDREAAGPRASDDDRPSLTRRGFLSGSVAGIGAVVVAGVGSYRLTRSPLPALVVGPPVLLWLLAACGAGLPGLDPLFSAFGQVFGAVFGAPLALLGVVLVAVLGAVALLFVDADAGLFREEAYVPDEETTEADLAAVGEAAGAAAERIETDADVTNEVYRAWVEMTRHLEVAHPDATTADEFAEAAVAAGMASDDVETLTRLFQDVRYGGVDPETRADEAVATLRRIEDTYGNGRANDARGSGGP